MKNLLVLIALIFSTNALSDIGLINRSISLAADGSIKDGVVEKVFINVINRDGASAAVGKIMCLDLTEDDGASVVSCPAVAGGVPVCFLAETCADDALCKCQTYGLFDSAIFENGGGDAAAGDAVYLSEATAGSIQHQATAGGADIPAGIFYDATSGAGTAQIFIKLR